MNTEILHANLLKIKGIGVLLIGDSGVGKSDASLALIERGHSLVADDQVELYTYRQKLHGRALKPYQPFLHIPNIGMINVTKQYGAKALSLKTEIHLIINMNNRWQSPDNIDLIDDEITLLDRPIPCVTLTACQDRQLASLIEAATGSFILLKKGYNAAIEFTERQRIEMNKPHKAHKDTSSS
jgi:HPr kinase/phosphorylase